MENKQITVESFVDLADYNGYHDELVKLYNYIKTDNEDEYVIGFPDWLSEYDHDHFLRVFWSILVIEYGDYGTSPRFGWLQKENVALFLEKFKNALGEENAEKTEL